MPSRTATQRRDQQEMAAEHQQGLLATQRVAVDVDRARIRLISSDALAVPPETIAEFGRAMDQPA